jgi:hypothetical protein
MGINFLHCTHGGERITLHDIIRDTFTTTVRDVGFHVSQKQPMFYQPLPYSLRAIELTLCF